MKKQESNGLKDFPHSSFHLYFNLTGTVKRTKRLPTPQEYEDLIFGWLVEAGVTSNSVLYVKDGVTVGIGTGEHDGPQFLEEHRDVGG